MRNKLGLGLSVGMLSLICAICVIAQDSRLTGVTGDKYLISAKAGGVNLVSGTVTVARNDGTAGRLVAGESLDIGDRVTTGDDGRAEVLLNPGSYLRVSSNSAFKFISTDLEDLKVDLSAGTAIFEVIADDDFRVSVRMPKQRVVLNRTGVYRIDVTAEGNARLAVFKGDAFVGPNAQTKVESGRVALLTTNGTSVSKFDRDVKDPFDVWSKARGKDLMKANAQLQQKALRNSLLNSFDRRGWDMYNSFGLWIFNPMHSGWCFLPFGDGWYSPYGWGFNSDIWWFNLPRYVYRPPTSGGTAGGSTAGPITRPVGPSGGRTKVPAFIQMQGGGSSSSGADVNRRSGDGLINNGGFNRGVVRPSKQDTPIYTPPAPVMAPSMPVKVDTVKRPG